MLTTLALVALAQHPKLPYPKAAHPTSELYVISSYQRSPAELLCLDTLAGTLARTSPRLYRVADDSWESSSDSYAAWLRAMRAQGVLVDSSLLNSSVSQVVSSFSSAAGPLSYVLADGTTRYARQSPNQTWSGVSVDPGAWAWASHDSISAALTLSAAKDDLIVAADSSLAAALEAVGVKQYADARHQKVGDILRLPGVMGTLSRDIYIFQDPSKASFLGDYGTFARAATLSFGSEPEAQAALLARNTSCALGAAFGWGPENSYVSTNNGAGVYVHASDYCTSIINRLRILYPQCSRHTHAPHYCQILLRLAMRQARLQFKVCSKRQVLGLAVHRRMDRGTRWRL